MCETWLRFILKGFFKRLMEAKPAEIILAKFGASIKVICWDLTWSSMTIITEDFTLKFSRTFTNHSVQWLNV